MALCRLEEANGQLASRSLAIRPGHAETIWPHRKPRFFEHESPARKRLPDFERAVALKPDYVRAHLNEGIRRLKMGGDFWNAVG